VRGERRRDAVGSAADARLGLAAAAITGEMPAQPILVIEDDPELRVAVSSILASAGHSIVEAENGRDGLKRLYATAPGLVILDISMPHLDGWQTLDRIRDLTDVPVLMLSAHASEVEKVRALRGGADDYVVKPFGKQELLARVDALLRRAGAEPPQQQTYADDYVAIDFAERSVLAAGSPVGLTPLEFGLLTALVRHRNIVLSHDQLLELVWGDKYTSSRDEVKLYVSYLRRKLAAAAGQPAPIETVRGFGYRYVARAHQPPEAS
jgi:DNA-binding response OmpR family regulator